jgi:hypothetical protein
LLFGNWNGGGDEVGAKSVVLVMLKVGRVAGQNFCFDLSVALR